MIELNLFSILSKCKEIIKILKLLMSIDEKFIPIRDAFYRFVETIFKNMAELFGYPDNFGMPTISNLPNEFNSKSRLFNDLSYRITNWPPIERPENWFEVIFGPSPKIDPLPRYIYESQQEGFYNFYIENYKNIYFLPDWLSQFIQLRLHVCLDLTVLEAMREILFISIVVYSQIISFRILLAWFIYINPYSFPWSYLVAMIDWVDEAFQGISPSLLGLNLTITIFLTILGKIADSLNNIVFTMPFLPSEGEKTKLLINEEMKDVIVFHFLPILWYRYPIPNEIREFWYNERLDIFNYMQEAYRDLGIQFLPNGTILEIRNQILTTKLFLIYDFLTIQDF